LVVVGFIFSDVENSIVQIIMEVAGVGSLIGLENRGDT
jgi:hypothetical protein